MLNNTISKLLWAFLSSSFSSAVVQGFWIFFFIPIDLHFTNVTVHAFVSQNLGFLSILLCSLVFTNSDGMEICQDICTLSSRSLINLKSGTKTRLMEFLNVHQISVEVSFADHHDFFWSPCYLCVISPLNVCLFVFFSLNQFCEKHSAHIHTQGLKPPSRMPGKYENCSLLGHNLCLLSSFQVSNV